MPDNSPDALADSSPAPDAGADSSSAPDSTATPQTPGQAPPPTSQPEGAKPWNQPPEERWQEVLRQRDEARGQAAAALQVLQQVQAGHAAPVGPTPPDPLEGLVDHPDPGTARFWQQVQRVSEAIADRKAQERLGPLTQALDLGRQQLAQVTVSQFRRDNPEIAPGSTEEQAIISRVNQGYPLEDAKRIVMYDVLHAKLSQRSTQQTQRQAEQRRQASPETTAGIPATAGGVQAKGSYRETMDAELRAAGI